MTTMEQLRQGRLSLALGLLLASAPWAAAQEQPAPEKKNSVYVEMGGSSYWATLNYERMLSSRINVRVGAGVIPGDLQPAGYPLTIGGPDLGVVPDLVVSSNVLFGKRRQLTAGLALHWEWNRVNPLEASEAVYGGAEFGYRHRWRSGFLLKTSVAMMLGSETLWLLPSLSLGWSF